MDDGYLGNARLKRTGTELSYTEEQVLEIAKCADDPVYFIKTYVKIVNVDRGLVLREGALLDVAVLAQSPAPLLQRLCFQRVHAARAGHPGPVRVALGARYDVLPGCAPVVLA